MAIIEGSEVTKHNAPDSCWVVIHGKVWDVSEFLDEHPGGGAIILKCAGQDATEEYDSVHHPELVMETLPANKCLGDLKPDSLPKPAPSASSSSSSTSTETTEVQKAPQTFPPLSSIINLSDFEKVAQSYLPPEAWAFYSGGAEDEISVSDSRRLYARMSLRPRILRDVSAVSCATTFLSSRPSSLPLYISATGRARYAHRDGERILASVAASTGIPYLMPTRTSASLESIFSAATGSEAQKPFLQLYANPDRSKSASLIQRAETLGAGAIFLTVDSPVLGRRERDDRARIAKNEPVFSGSGSGLLDPTLVWSDINWIRSLTNLPLVIKGVQTVQDALAARQAGASGIVLSNHGGRSLDSAQAPILTLLEIRRYAPQLLGPEVRKTFSIFIDGGIRRGTDVIKALALGAAGVGLGRPFLYSMVAGYGEEGCKKMVAMLKNEIETSMALLGATSVDELEEGMVNSERAEKEVSRRVKL